MLQIYQKCDSLLSVVHNDLVNVEGAIFLCYIDDSLTLLFFAAEVYLLDVILVNHQKGVVLCLNLIDCDYFC